MRILTHFSRFFVGLLFIFSGVIKLNDPVGTQIKLEEYFEVFAEAFTPYFEHLVPYALYFSVILCVAEVVLGLALLLFYRMQLTLWLLLLLIIFFTFLTLYSAFFNKVTDCGCFGDFIKLTPWGSFTKDIVLLIPIVFLFLRRDKLESPFNDSFNLILVGLGTAGSIYFAMHCINHLPVWDFRPYHIGAHIPSKMKTSEQLKYRYQMEKDGKKEWFDEYPMDTTYTYVQMETVNPEAMPKITDYSVWNDEGQFTDSTFVGTRLIFVAMNTQKSYLPAFSKISNLIHSVNEASSLKISPMILTSSERSEIELIRHNYQLACPVYYADATVLKTIIRSNPGVWMLKDGTVIGKWHYNDVPNIEELIEVLQKKQ